MVLEKTLESPLGSKEIKPVNPKGNQPRIFTGRTDANAPILWPRYAKNWLIGKDPDARKDWRQKEKGMTEDEVVGWHHQRNGHESANSRIQRRIGEPGVLQSVGLQWVEHELVTEQQQQKFRHFLGLCPKFLSYFLCSPWKIAPMSVALSVSRSPRQASSPF